MQCYNFGIAFFFRGRSGHYIALADVQDKDTVAERKEFLRPASNKISSFNIALALHDITFLNFDC